MLVKPKGRERLLLHGVADQFQCWRGACRTRSCLVCCATSRGRSNTTCHSALTYLNRSSEYSSISCCCRLTHVLSIFIALSYAGAWLRCRRRVRLSQDNSPDNSPSHTRGGTLAQPLRSMNRLVQEQTYRVVPQPCKVTFETVQRQFDHRDCFTCRFITLS